MALPSFFFFFYPSKGGPTWRGSHALAGCRKKHGGCSYTRLLSDANLSHHETSSASHRVVPPPVHTARQPPVLFHVLNENKKKPPQAMPAETSTHCVIRNTNKGKQAPPPALETRPRPTEPCGRASITIGPSDGSTKFIYPHANLA